MIHLESGTCTNGAVRLVNGSTSNEGRVEYCYNGDWVPSCGMSSITASLVCKQLGYNSTCKSKQYFSQNCELLLSDVSVFNDERFSRSNMSSTFNYKYCSRSQSSITNCTDVIKESLCYINPSRCSTEYGLRCYSK